MSKYTYRIESPQHMHDFCRALSNANLYPLEITVDDAPQKQRTLTQNAALHLWLQQVADYLNAAGLDMKKVMKPHVDIPWTMVSAKEHLWRPIQHVLIDKKSSAQASTVDIQIVYQTLSSHLIQKFQLPHLPHWPSKNPPIIGDEK